MENREGKVKDLVEKLEGRKGASYYKVAR